jgi:hypothetical protein
MSAQPKDTAPPVEMVEFEIDGHPVRAPKGSMIIQAADAANIALVGAGQPAIGRAQARSYNVCLIGGLA